MRSAIEGDSRREDHSGREVLKSGGGGEWLESSAPIEGLRASVLNRAWISKLEYVCAILSPLPGLPLKYLHGTRYVSPGLTPWATFLTPGGVSVEISTLNSLCPQGSRPGLNS